MSNKQIVLLYVIATASTFLLAIFWEFFLEGIVNGLFGIIDHETNEHRWENALTATLFVFIALMVPSRLASKIRRRQLLLERELAASEEKYRRFFEDSREGIFLAGTDGKIVDINRAALEIFGLEREEALSINVGDVCQNPEARDLFQKEMLKKGWVKDFEMKLRRKDGREIRCVVNAHVRYADDGTVTGYEGNVSDVTEKLEAEKALRLTQASIDSASVGAFWIDGEGRFLYVNNQAVKSLGFSRKELLSMRVSDIDPGFPAEMWPRHMEEIRKKRTLSFESGHKTKDGLVFPVDITANYLEFDGREYNFAFARDISDRKNAEGALKLSEEKYRTLVESVQDAVVLVKDGKFQFVNSAFSNMTGYEIEECIGMDMLSIIAPEDRELVKGNYQKRILGEGAPSEYEFRLLHKDGASRTYVNLHAIKVEQGNEIITIGTVKNITERKKSEKNLKEIKEQLQSIIDNTTSVIFLKDTEGKYLLINRRYSELFHVGKEEAVGKTDYDIFPEDMANAFRKNDSVALKADRPLEMEEVVPHDDGLHTYISIKFPLHSSDGKPYGVCGIATDITERKKTEDSLRQAKKEAEDATLLKDKFVSLVSHDLKTPLSVMLGNLELLVAGQQGEFSEKVLSVFSDIKTAGLSAVVLADDILNVNRIKGGKITPRLKHLSAERMAIEAIVNCSQHARAKGVNLECDIKPEDIVSVDKGLMGEVLKNLIGNSVKFTRKGGSVRVYMPDRLTIAVQDNGVGVREDLSGNLFSWDKKTTSVGTDGERGSGFGLPLSRDIVEAHLGTLEFESEPDKGSTFFISLPDNNSQEPSLKKAKTTGIYNYRQ